MKTFFMALTLSAFMFIVMTVLISGCTYSITQVHTSGSASDLIDDTDNVSPSTHVTVPVKAI